MRYLSIGAILFDVIGDAEYIGGAPFNLALHLKRLGEDSLLFSSVGLDERAARALRFMQAEGMADLFIQRHESLPTGVTLVTFDDKGEPNYDLPIAAFDALRVDDAVRTRLRDFAPEVVCFGSIEQRTVENHAAIMRIIDAVAAREVFFDVNLRMGFEDARVLRESLGRSTILKLNRDEMLRISLLLKGEEMNREAFCPWMAQTFDLRCVLVTLGGDGCYLYADGAGALVSTTPCETGDPIGAGDAFSAGFLFSLMSGCTPLEAAHMGHVMGSYVAGHTGALPAYTPELLLMFERLRRT